MVEKSKLNELEKNIADKEKELQEAKNQRKKVEGNPAEMVAWDKKIAELQRTISALQNTKRAVTYMPPAKSDVNTITSCLDKYFEAKREKVQKVQDSLDQTVAEIRTTEQQLEQATNDGAVDDVVLYSEKLNELREREKYIEKMIQDTEAIATFPAGAITEEWEKICKEKQSDWNMLLQRIELLAEEYRSACDELVAMKDTLTVARREMKKVADAQGIVFNPDPILTVGVNTEKMRISKADGLKPELIFYRDIGQQLL